MMFYIPPRIRLLVIVLVIGIILTATILISLSFNTPQPQDKAAQIPPAGVPIFIEDSDLQTEPTFKNYLTIKLNDSSKTLEDLPDLVAKSDLSDGKTRYEYFSTYPGINNIVISKNQLVAFKSTVTVSGDNYKTPMIDTYTNTYGPAAVEFTGSEKYGRFAKTYIYPSLGFALIFNPVTKEVYEVQSFNPVSLDEYIREWGSDMKDYSKESPQPEF